MRFHTDFTRDGFLVIEAVFAENEVDDLSRRLRSAGLGRAGVRNLMSDECVYAIANDARLTSLAGELTRTEMQPFKATLFAKTGKANWLVAWHQDTALPIQGGADTDGWGPLSVKQGVTFSHAPTEALTKIVALRLHLDDSTGLNGPLRVIPGSHQKRLTDEEEFRAWLGEPSIECRVKKGGVLAMRPLLIHASSKCLTNASRRVLHIEYAPGLVLEPKVRLVVA